MHFVETCFTKHCFEKLEELKMIVIIGPQGSGKTMTARHIQNISEYKDWNKTTITTRIDPIMLMDGKPEKRFIIIDNLFDGYEYQQELFKWWDVLYNFYTTSIRERDNVRLIITIKDKVLEKAKVFIDKEKYADLEKCYLLIGKFPLSATEKIGILKNQYEIAKKLTGTDYQFLECNFKMQLLNDSFEVGFPLCAHLYAFEAENDYRDDSIFSNPKHYARKLIAREIDNDNTGCVKSLFLILLFWLCPGESTRRTGLLDLKSNMSFHHSAVHEMLENIEKYTYEGLDEKAQELEGKYLIKNENMYEFKHQIYLEGVGNYFLRHYFKFAIKYFSIDILKFCDGLDLSKDDFDDTIKRTRKDLGDRLYSKILSWDILQNAMVQQAVCDSLSTAEFRDQLLTSVDETSALKFPFIFWASKYKLSKLANFIIDICENNRWKMRNQCLFAMLGEYCAVDEHYIKSIDSPQDIKELRSKICAFRNSNQETVLHLLLSSDKSDYNAARFFEILFEEPQGLESKVDTDILKVALKHQLNSRIICILKTLNIIKSKYTQNNNSIAGVMAKSDWEFPSNKKHFELEIVCRICILAVYGADVSLEAFNYCTNLRYRDHIPALSDEIKNKMAARIETLQQNLPSCQLSKPEIPSMSNMTPQLEEAIRKSIQILANRAEHFDNE